uniref:Uncharacterized protein n=1 Tax=Anguilla anguilla TaxID=7936 RepID=A0A0E9VQK0_ANGAN
MKLKQLRNSTTFSAFIITILSNTPYLLKWQTYGM